MVFVTADDHAKRCMLRMNPDRGVIRCITRRRNGLGRHCCRHAKFLSREPARGEYGHCSKNEEHCHCNIGPRCRDPLEECARRIAREIHLRITRKKGIFIISGNVSSIPSVLLVSINTVKETKPVTTARKTKLSGPSIRATISVTRPAAMM